MPAQVQILEGLAGSEGIGIGRAVVIETRTLDVYRFPLPAAEVEKEIQRFRESVRQTQRELKETRARVGATLGEELAAIFDAHALVLADRAFVGRIVERIRREHINAEWAVHKTAEDLGEDFARLESPYLRERGEDLRDVSRHLLRSLQGISHHELSEIEGDVVIVADDLTPSETVRLGRERVVGFAVETGGRTSHTTIIARSLNLPLVAGLEGVTQLVTDEDPVVVDGSNGKVLLHPTPELLAQYRQRQREIHLREQDLLATRELTATTRDGTEIHLMANIDLPEEIEDAIRFGAAGVGLYRSEFLYIEKSPELPTEEEHLAIYRRLLEAMAPYPVVIRTYDLGGRKLAREILETHEDNPVLGLRGIRLTLARQEIFKTQLRALFRAGLHGDLWVMLPMVSMSEEIQQFRAFVDRVMRELEGEGIPFQKDFKLGIMIEVPSAALIADQLVREVDFVSIGTNDLIQYALAVDRNNEHVSYLYRPLHPAILRMIGFVVDAAAEAGIDAAICGEMAGDEDLVALLLAMGLRRLSVSPRRVPDIKTKVRQLSMPDLAGLRESCLQCRSAAEVQELLEGLPGEAITDEATPGTLERS